MNTLKISLVLLTIIPLSACSAYKERFKCQAQDGLGCRSITEVNDLVNQGWPSRDALKNKKKKKCDFFSRLCQSKASKTTQSIETADTGSFNPLSTHSSQQSFRIWMAPFKTENQYWDEQFVYYSSATEHPKKIHSPEAST